jgi:hypothetical protein
MSISIADLLATADEDTFLAKLAQREKAGSEKTAVGAQGESAGAPGSATAAAPIGGGDTAHGAVSPGGDVDIMNQQMADSTGDMKIKLMDQAMSAAAAELAAASAATRGAGTDEGHNAGTQPRSGVQEYQLIASPQAQLFQDAYQPMEADGAAGGMKAAQAKDLISRLAAEAQKTAAQQTKGGQQKQAAQAAEVVDDQEKLAVARAQANECVAQGLYVHEGIKHGLMKAAESGELTEIFAGPIAQSHAAAFQALSESDVMDKFAEKLASQIVDKVEKKLGIQSGT